MASNSFDDALEQIKRIADAVSAFPSEGLQGRAFDILTAAAGLLEPREESLLAPTRADGPTAQGPPARAAAPQPQQAEPSKGVAKRGTARGQWTFDRNLDLRPTGKISFVEFVTEKNPSTNEDRYAVIVYYLSEILEYPAVTIDHVGSVFRLTPGWREPKVLAAGLRMASSRKGTLDTSDAANIRLTVHGRNFVEHDLPPP